MRQSGMGLTTGNQFFSAVPVAITASPSSRGVTHEAEDGCGEECCFHLDRVLVLSFFYKDMYLVSFVLREEERRI